MDDNFFLKPETREGFHVSEKRKKIWKIQLQLLSVVEKICKENDLQYYASNGTLLGAVKYSGFVPWDDDMDIMMPREDYLRFVRIAREKLSSPYYFQDADDSETYYRPYGRLRYELSTALSPVDMDREERSGIFIDIFPICGVDKEHWEKQEKKIILLDKLIVAYVYPEFLWKTIKTAVKKVIARTLVNIHSYKWMIQKLNSFFDEMPYLKADPVFIYTHQKPVVIKKSDLNEWRYVSFEYTQIRIPCGYDTILRAQYGEYKDSLPPLEDRGAHHTIFIDPDKPYSEYYKKFTQEQLKDTINNF